MPATPHEYTEGCRSGDGGYDEDDPVVILARAALHPDSSEATTSYLDKGPEA